MHTAKAVWLGFLLIVFCSSALPAQSNTEILLNRLRNSSGKQKADCYNKLAKAYTYIETKKGLKYSDSALYLAKHLHYSTGEAEALDQRGVILAELCLYDSSFSCLNTALSIRKRDGSKEGTVTSLNNLALLNIYTADYDKAMEYLMRAIPLAEEIEYSKGKGDAFNLIGIVYYIWGDLNKALDYSTESLKIRTRIGDMDGIGFSNENLGIINMKLGKMDKSLQYHQKALETRKILNEKGGIAGSYSNIGIVFRKQKLYDKALEHLEKSLKIREEIGDARAIGSTLASIGSLYIETNNYTKALECLERSYRIRKQIRDLRGTISTLKLISDLYEKQGNYKESLNYFKLQSAYKDTVFNETNARDIAEVAAKYGAEKKEREIQLLQKDNEVQRKLQGYLISVMLLITVLSAVVSLAYRSKKKHNKALNERNREIQAQKEELSKLNTELQSLNANKDKFFSIIAHDLKSPFISLLGYSEFLAKDLDELTPEEIRKYSEGIYESAHSVFKLLDNLLCWSRLNSGHFELNPISFNLSELVDESLSLFKTSAEGKKIRLIGETEPANPVFADKDMVHIVLRNLVSNALKFTKPGGEVKVKINTDGNFREVIVEDTGLGMHPEDIEKLFKIESHYSTRGTRNESGTGLGLLLCKEFVEKNGGKIRVESCLNEGSSFIFTLPVERRN